MDARNCISIWRGFGDPLVSVRAVLAAEKIPTEAMNMARREKYITMDLSGEALSYVDWANEGV